MHGIHRVIGAASAQTAPATADITGEMLKHCPDNLKGKRDQAFYRSILPMRSRAPEFRHRPQSEKKGDTVDEHTARSSCAEPSFDGAWRKIKHGE